MDDEHGKEEEVVAVVGGGGEETTLSVKKPSGSLATSERWFHECAMV
jgi:hypothetical protein